MTTLPGLDPQALRALIQQTLTPLSLYSADAEELLMATCANESNLGQFRAQTDGGPGQGIFQIETSDFNDIWTNYLAWRKPLAAQLRALNGGLAGTAEDLDNNDAYSIALARVHYSRCPGALPKATDLNGIWAYYKEWYNTPAGAALEGIFKYKYEKYVAGSAK
jgi:hypothetical protein